LTAQQFGGIEAGGTKFVCAVGSGPEDIRDQIRFSTTSPDETLGKAVDFFKRQSEPLAAIGIGSFGPLDPDRSSHTFGHITSTPKPGWSNTDIVGAIKAEFDVPVGFDTDVNAAALGEQRWGAAQGLDTFVYLTIGTGIGGGAMVAGQLLHGMLHPEMGHVLLPHDRQRDPFEGFCPFHKDCFEGLAAGPAIKARWGKRGEDLPANHPAWELEAHYVALGVMTVIMMLSPQRVILGGGVMQEPQLFPLVRRKVPQLINGYVQTPQILEGIKEYIVPPGLGGRAGVLGAIALAQRVKS
jgi:fructokinase